MRSKRITRSNKSTNGNKHSDDSFSESFKEKLKQYTKQKKIKMETSSSSDDSTSTISSKTKSDESSTIEKPSKSESKKKTTKVTTSNRKDNTDKIMEQLSAVRTARTSKGISSGYMIKLNSIKVPSETECYIIEMDISNQIGQLNIYLKASYLLDVLKDFCTNMRKAYPTLVEKYQIEKYQPIIQSGRVVELRDVAQGDNKCRSSFKDGREYKDYINYFLFPTSFGSLKVVLEDFKSFLQTAFSSKYFFVLMTLYTKELNNTGGKIGIKLREKDSEPWKILQEEEKYVVDLMQSLDAKFMNENINSILESMFPSNSYKEKYQKIGWMNKSKGKKN